MSEKKKKLLMEYKYRKPEMGIIAIKCIVTGKDYIGYANDTKAAINGNQFKLEAGMHPNKSLQSEWNNHSKSKFYMQVLEVLSYDEKDESKADYSKELESLRDKWINEMENSEIL